ncbi:MAG: hypothetical protein HYZ67_02660, partial [Chlamydiae bacterium]|nr:hypothetical protein [Chlamydiota bacterium]
MIKILSSVLATLQIFLSIPIEAQAQVQMQRILQTPVQNLAELQENLSWTQKANECQNTPRGPMGIVFENLFNQLISSIQIITEEIEGHPTKTTEIKFSDAIYNKLGQLQAYQELQQTKVGNEESINLKEVSSLQYSILGLQVGAIESRSEGLNLIHQETKEILNQSYDEAGRLTGDKSKTTLSTGEVIKSQKTNISYDNYGNITSFNESGHSNASGSYSFSRSQTFNALGETTSTAEEGTRSNGGSYQSTETNIIYDELGRKISFKRIEKDSLGKHITDRTSTSFDEQGRVSSYEQTTEDHLSNGHRTSNTEHRTNIQYDAQNRMTKWTSHTWGTNAEGKSFNQTTTTHVLDFDHAGRATQLKESWNNHTEGKSGTNNITQGYNHQGQLAWKEIPDEKGDIAHHTYTYSSSGALEKEEISHPDYIITLDAYGTQQSFKYGPRLAAQIKEAEEQARRAQDQARNAQKAASKAMSIYKKQVTQELLKQAEKIKQQAAIQISKAQQTASQAKSLAQQALRTAQQALQQAQTKIQQAKSTAERAKAEGERKIAQAQVKVAQAKLALLQATTQAAKQAALKALEIAKQELEKIKSQVASVKSQGNAVILSEAKNLVVKFSGNRAWVQDENGNKLAEAVLKGNTIKIDNLVTGHHVDMKLGRYGIENITETNGRGLVVRTESYKYDAKNRTYTYSIHDTEPTTIETSQGSKTVKGKGTYVANGVVKYDSKNRIIASEENKILKSGNKTIYSYHDKLENVTFDKVGNTVNFHKETSEKGMGIKKYSTTIDRAGTVDDKGLLNYYKETEHTKVKGSKISRTYEAHPEYGANNVLIDEHREMTSEKVKSSGGFLKKFLMPAISIALGIILAPVTAGISTMLTTSFALGATAATALATGITAFASSFLTSIAMGAKPMDALKGALVSGLAAGIGSGIFPGAGLPSLDNFSIMKQIVKPILTSVAFNTVSEEIGGTVGVVTATIGTGLVNTAFGGTPTRADFIVKTLGSTALTVATETMRRDDGSMP